MKIRNLPIVGGRDVVMAPVSESAPAAATAHSFPAVEVPGPSLAPEGGDFFGLGHCYHRGGDGASDVPVHRLPRHWGH
jgi:hypothetical protein